MSNNIAIMVNGEGLDLPSDLSINFTLKNKLFYRTVIPGINSYDINIPVTERNRRILGFRDVIEAESPLGQTLEATLILEGVKYADGLIRIRGAGSNSYRASFQAFNQELKQLEGLTLKDLDLGTQFYPKQQYFSRAQVNYEIFSNETAEVKINGQTFSQAFTSDMYNTIKSLAAQINSSGLRSNLVASANIRKAALQSSSIQNEEARLFIDALTTSQNLNVTVPSGNSTTSSNVIPPSAWDNNVRWLNLNFLDANVDKQYPAVKLAFPTIYNPDFYSQSELPEDVAHQNLVNDYGVSDHTGRPRYIVSRNVEEHIFGREFGPDFKSTNDYLKPVLPCPFVVHVVDKIFEAIGVQARGDFMDDTEIQKLCLLGDRAFDDRTRPFVDYFVNNGPQGDGYYLPVADFVPNINVIKFLKDIFLNYFNCVINFTGSEALITFGNNIIDKRDQLSVNRITEHNIRLDQERGLSFEYKQPDDDFYNNRHKDQQVIDAKQISGTVSSFTALPSNPANNTVYFVQNVNAYYIYKNRWSILSYDYYDYEPVTTENMINIKPEAAIIPVVQRPKAFQRTPVLELYFSQNGQSKSEIKLDGTIYKGDASNRNVSLGQLANDINDRSDKFGAEAYKVRDTNNNVYPTIAIYTAGNVDPVNGFSWTFAGTDNQADEVRLFVAFSSNPSYKNIYDSQMALLMPALKKRGNSNNYQTASSESPYRLFFYRGLQPAAHADGYDYPLGTPDIYDARGNEIGTYALRWRGSKGIYKNFWKTYNEAFTNAKNVEAQFAMDFQQLNNIGFGTQLESEGNLYWWRELQFQVNMSSGIQPVKGKLLKQH